MNGRQLLDLMEKLIVWLTGIPILVILIFFSIIGFFVGLFLINKPALAIEIQRRLYYLINWKIEPVSMEKEIRHTRIMGWLLVILLAVILLLAFSQKTILF